MFVDIKSSICLVPSFFILRVRGGVRCLEGAKLHLLEVQLTAPYSPWEQGLWNTWPEAATGTAFVGKVRSYHSCFSRLLLNLTWTSTFGGLVIIYKVLVQGEYGKCFRISGSIVQEDKLGKGFWMGIHWINLQLFQSIVLVTYTHIYICLVILWNNNSNIYHVSVA